ncbi:hypothetical protein NIB75_10350 [Bacteroides uniformis]|nr:hypothetical protein [Bacteroides uniformis]
MLYRKRFLESASVNDTSFCYHPFGQYRSQSTPKNSAALAYRPFSTKHTPYLVFYNRVSV